MKGNEEKLDKPSFTKEYRKYDIENGTKGIKLWSRRTMA